MARNVVVRGTVPLAQRYSISQILTSRGSTGLCRFLLTRVSGRWLRGLVLLLQAKLRFLPLITSVNYNPRIIEVQLPFAYREKGKGG